MMKRQAFEAHVEEMRQLFGKYQKTVPEMRYENAYLLRLFPSLISIYVDREDKWSFSPALQL